MFYKLDLDLDDLDLDLDLDDLDLDLDMETCFYNPTRDPPPHCHGHPCHHPNYQTCLISWM